MKNTTFRLSVLCIAALTLGSCGFMGRTAGKATRVLTSPVRVVVDNDIPHEIATPEVMTAYTD